MRTKKILLQFKDSCFCISEGKATNSNKKDGKRLDYLGDLPSWLTKSSSSDGLPKHWLMWDTSGSKTLFRRATLRRQATLFLRLQWSRSCARCRYLLMSLGGQKFGDLIGALNRLAHFAILKIGCFSKNPWNLPFRWQLTPQQRHAIVESLPNETQEAWLPIVCYTDVVVLFLRSYCMSYFSATLPCFFP